MTTTCFPNTFSNGTPWTTGFSNFAGSCGYQGYSQPNMNWHGYSQPTFSNFNTPYNTFGQIWNGYPYSQPFAYGYTQPYANCGQPYGTYTQPTNYFGQPFGSFTGSTGTPAWNWYQNSYVCDPSGNCCPPGACGNWQNTSWNPAFYGSMYPTSPMNYGWTPGAYHWMNGNTPSFTNFGCPTGSYAQNFAYPYAFGNTWTMPGYGWNSGSSTPFSAYTNPFAHFSTPGFYGAPSFQNASSFPFNGWNWNTGYGFNTPYGFNGYATAGQYNGQCNGQAADAARYQTGAPNGTMNLKRDAA